ncbi:MAG TPA: outer membrane beta-barrel protein [Verrucomicrobiae bacterium]|nr:outer membrane beta-barrel protein [Verrucomicrobiae bacterium]
MNPTTRIVGAIGITLLIGNAASHAQSWTDNLYVHTDIGPAFIPARRTTTYTIALPFDGLTRGHGHFQVDTGVRGDLALGYNLSKSFALEVEAGGIWSPDSDPRDSFYQIPAMLNAIYQIHISDSWKAYVGAGAGGVVSMVHTEYRDAAFHSPIIREASDWSPGYQAEAGIKYAFSRHIDIDLGYKFLGVVEYDYTFGNIPSPDFAIVKVNNLYTHSAQLSLTWKF